MPCNEPLRSPRVKQVPSTTASECLGCSGLVVQTVLLFVFAALLVVTCKVIAERNLGFLMLLVSASRFVALLQSLTLLEMLDVDWRPVVGKLVLLPALVALLFIVAFVYSSLAKAPLHVNTAVSSIGELFTMFYLVLALISLEPFVCWSLRPILRDGLLNPLRSHLRTDGKTHGLNLGAPFIRQVAPCDFVQRSGCTFPPKHLGLSVQGGPDEG